jgi:CRP-like cAMP-binding protein
MSDFLEDKRAEIKARLDELKPLVDEYHRLEAAERALAGVDAPRGSGGGAPKPAPRPRRSSDGNGDGGGRGRPKGSGQRAQQALELVRSQPGITIPDLAESMGIKQNYLYRVMPDLAEQGLVTKSGRGWHIRQ